jgi:hypothetical protein
MSHINAETQHLPCHLTVMTKCAFTRRQYFQFPTTVATRNEMVHTMLAVCYCFVSRSNHKFIDMKKW